MIDLRKFITDQPDSRMAMAMQMLYQKSRSDSLGFLRDITREQYDHIQEYGWSALECFGCSMDLYDIVDIDGTQKACTGQSINPLVYALADTMFKKGTWKTFYCSDRTISMICDVMDAKVTGWEAPAYREMKEWLMDVYNLPDGKEWPVHLARHWMSPYDGSVKVDVNIENMYDCDETVGALAVMYFNSRCDEDDVLDFLNAIGLDTSEIISYRGGYVSWVTNFECYDCYPIAMELDAEQLISILAGYPDRRELQMHEKKVIRLFCSDHGSQQSNSSRFIDDVLNTFQTNEMVIL